MFSQNKLFGQNASNNLLFGSKTPTFENKTPNFGQTQFGNCNFGNNKNAPNSQIFGSSAFSNVQNASFGQANNSSLFNSSANALNNSNNSVFGNSSFGTPNLENAPKIAIGSPPSFTPVVTADNVLSGGIFHSVNVKYQSLSTLTGYESKTFEEIRLEDYQMGKKHGLAQTNQITPQNNTNTQNTSIFSSLLPQNNTQTLIKQNTPLNNTSSGFGFGTNSNISTFKTDINRKPIINSSFAQNNMQNINNNSQNISNNSFGQNMSIQNVSNSSFGQNTSLFIKPTPTFPTLNNTNLNTNTSFNINSVSNNPPVGYNSGVANVLNQLKNNTSTPFNLSNASNNNNTHTFLPNTSFNNNNSNQLGFLNFAQSNSNTNLNNNTNQFKLNMPLIQFQPPIQNNTPQHNTFSLKTPEQNFENIQNIVRHYDYYGSNDALIGLEPLKRPFNHYVTNPKELGYLISQKSSPVHRKESNEMVNKSKLVRFFPVERALDQNLLKVNRRKYLDIKEQADDRNMLLNSLDHILTQKTMVEIKNTHSNSTLTKKVLFKNVSTKIVGNLKERLNESEIEMVKRHFNVKDDSTDSDSLYEDAIDDPSILISDQTSCVYYEESSSKLFVNKTTNTDESFADFLNHSLGDYESFSNKINKSINKNYKEIETNNNNILLELPNCVDTIVRLKNTSDFSSITKRNMFDSYQSTLDDSMQNFDNCQVIFTRPDYYMIPDFSKISKYKTNDAKCIIDGLTIGRLGYGNIYFRKPVNIFGLNIDEILTITHKSLTIYPDNEKMPQKGMELHVPAQITLDRVYPKNKDEDEITSPFGETLSIFVDNLKRVCSKMNANFVDYRPETGSWVFTVEHF